MMHSSSLLLRQKHSLPCDTGKLFGGNHVIFLGDSNQHDPISNTGNPLYYNANASSEKLLTWAADPRSQPSNCNYAGYHLWRKFTSVCLLTEQHRFDMTSPSGRQLYDIVQRICSDEQQSDAWIGELIDTLQARAKATQAQLKTLLQHSPSVVVQRNVLKPYANLALAQNHAFQAGQRMLVWRALDLDSKTGRALSGTALEWLENLHPQKTGDMPTWQMFFEGMKYTFPDSPNPKVRWIKNMVCHGVKILLHKNEPPDDLSKPYRVLKYLPRGVIVRPEGNCIGRLSSSKWLPKGCLLIPTAQIKTFSIKLPEPIQIYADDEDSRAYTLSVKRKGLNLGSAYAPTTFFAQGISFKKNKYLLDLCPPEVTNKSDKFFFRANISVPISRPSTLDDVHPLLLWRDKAGRQAVFTAYKRALKPKEDRVADNKRLARLHDLTLTKEAQLYRRCVKDTRTKVSMHSYSLFTVLLLTYSRHTDSYITLIAGPQERKYL